MGAFNGSGTFVRSYSWAVDAANAVNISATRMDTEDNGFAAGLTNCLTRDGQSSPTANLPMGGFKLTGLAAGTSNGESVRFEQLAGYAPLSGAAFTGDISTTGFVILAGLSNYSIGANAGNPQFNLDANDYLSYDRASNNFAVIIGNSLAFSVTAGGAFGSPNIPNAVGYKGIPFLGSGATNYTFALGDMSLCRPQTTGGWTIPANAAVAFPVGSILSGYNDSGSIQTVSITTDTLRLEGTATTGPRTVAQRSAWRALKVNTTEWVISGSGVT